MSWLHGFFRWVAAQDATAVRNACALTLPLAVGTIAGRPEQGGLAAIGAFTVLYTHNRPYRQRVRRWAYITALLMAAFAAGNFAAVNVWAGVIVIGVVAAVLTYLMKVVAIGPPAAYILVLVCATGTHLPPDPGALGGRLLLVFVGSVCGLLVGVAGWPIAPDAPERRAAATAMRAVAGFFAADAEPRPARRHAAQRALHDAAVTVAVGSRRCDPGRLARVVRELRHLVDRAGPSGLPGDEDAAENPSSAASRIPSVPADAELPAALTEVAADLLGHSPWRREITGRYRGLLHHRATAELAAALLARKGESGAPLEFPGPFAAVRARTPRAARSALRAGLAATAAGCIAVALQVDHPYWGAAAAVAVLANDGTRATVKRAWGRFAGTVVGVLVAAAIIATDPSPAAIVIITAVLQFVIQLVVSRSYGLAVVAITPLALLLADAATGQASTVDLFPRLLETAIGCTLALVARLVVFPNSSARHLPVAMAAVQRRKVEWAAASESDESELRLTRIRVERALLGLEDAVEAARDELRPAPATSRNILAASAILEETWPTVTLARPSRR